MTDLTNPHDRFFKELLSSPEMAADFLRNYLPQEVVAVLDLSAPEPVRDAFVDPDLQKHFADLLYRVRLRQGVEAFVYVLFEHKSSPDKWVALQLLRYLIRLWETLLTQSTGQLPPVYPIVFYHGQARWRAALNFRSLVAVADDSPLLKHVPEFEYYLVDLSTIDEEQLKGAPYLRAGLMLFRHIFSRELKQRLPDILHLLEPESDQPLIDHLRAITAYLSIATRGQLNATDVTESVAKALPKKGEDFMQTFLDEWIQQGLEKGLQQGLQQGRYEGQISLTLRQLRRRLGEVSDELEERVKVLSSEQLEELGESLLDFNALADLENWLRKQQPVN